MQIIYNVTNQFVVDVGDITKEEIMEMSEEEIVESMTDVMYGNDGYLGETSNRHGRVEFELLDDEDESIRHFEKDVD